MDIPILLTNHVYHIGTLDKKDRGSNFATSHEGHLLSVSLCPEAWREIARLGGSPWHKISTTSPLKFLDIFSAIEDEKLVEKIRDWAVENGLGEDRKMWKKWDTDEDGEWRFQTFRTEQEAIDEIDEFNDEGGPDGAPTVESCVLFVGTSELAKVVKDPGVENASSIDLICAVWAEKTLPTLDGVWWSEKLDIWSHSAPRGGIFPSKLAGMTTSRVKPFADSDYEGQSMEMQCSMLTTHKKPSPY